jgi:hypothetical protein
MTTAIAAAAAAAAAGRTFLTGAGFINRQSPALEILLVKHADCLGCIILRTHLNKRKAARAPGRAVLHDVDRDNGPCLGEVILQVVLGCGEGKIPYE